MECLGPQSLQRLIEWIEIRTGISSSAKTQGSLFPAIPYDEAAPVLRDEAELEAAFDHLEYSVFRRFNNQLTRAERGRLENTIDNAMFKIEQYLLKQPGASDRHAPRFAASRNAISAAREQAARRREQARRADAKIAQLSTLSPESFEEFIAELFEALGYQVEQLGGSGDEGADLRVCRAGLAAIVQCKYHSRGVIGSPDLQRFLGSVHHHRAHKGYFVTTRTFSLAAERFVADNPIELIDGPRLVELVREALGPVSKSESPSWF
jgi:restriction system protein